MAATNDGLIATAGPVSPNDPCASCRVARCSFPSCGSPTPSSSFRGGVCCCWLFRPGTGHAAAAFPLRRFIPYSDAVVDARTKLILLGISAYTFTVAFSVNTLWYQDIELGNAALSFDYSVSVLKDAAQEHADDLPAEIGERIEALRQPDVIVEVVSVLPRANQTFSQVG